MIGQSTTETHMQINIASPVSLITMYGQAYHMIHTELKRTVRICVVIQVIN